MKPLIRLFKALEVLRVSESGELPLQLAATFLWVAAHPGCLQQDLPEVVTVSPASISRCLDWLGETHRSGKPGLNLIRRERDDLDKKRWRVYLTPKGEQMARLIELQLKEES